MARDEHGMPLPYEKSPLPWLMDDCGCCIKDSNGDSVCEDGYGYERTEDIKFSLHAANNIIECRDIVRRLVEWSKSDLMDDANDIIEDAVKLLDKMQKEVGDEQ